ncbi:MAG: Dam family site-specific DNA-(adenine-N6)-methyltransferase [Burkholderiaceae bacterium]
MQSASPPWSRPIFRWAGSKKGILDHLRRCVPPVYGRYIEPFAGSACLFFALNPAKAILADFNSELMHAYGVLAKHPRLVIRMVSGLPDDASDYYAIRDLNPEKLPDLERAARFVYLNRFCFNGVYRTDRHNRFNVPRGTRAGRPLVEAEVVRCSVALRRAELLTDDFELTLGQARRDDFVYVDPPYTSAVRQTYGEYGYGAFSSNDVRRLHSRLEYLTKVGVKVLLSYSADRELLRLLEDWSVVILPVRRRIAGGSRSHETHEILASNYTDLRPMAH